MVLEPNMPLFMYIQVTGNVHRPSCVISGQYPGSKSQTTGLGQSMPDWVQMNKQIQEHFLTVFSKLFTAVKSKQPL